MIRLFARLLRPRVTVSRSSRAYAEHLRKKAETTAALRRVVARGRG